MISEAWRQQFMTEGYLVVPDVIPSNLRERVIDAILAFTGVRLDDPDTWYRQRREGHGIVPLHHHQALWDVRQHPAVYEIFKALYQQEQLWVTMDRVSYKPPASDETRDWQQAPVHWDCDPWDPDAVGFQHMGIQGLVYLTDTEAHQGAFSCVPSIYRNLEAWCQQHGDDDDRRHPAVQEEDVMAIPASAGSLVLWHRLMPHTSQINRSPQHRFVQYVAMNPASDDIERQERIRDYREKMPPAWAIRQEVPGQQMPEPGEPAELTGLGKKLVGMETW